MEIRNSLLFIIILFTQIIGITTGIVFYARNILYTGELQWLEHRSESVYFITNTRLFKYIENFTTKEKKEFSDKKKSDIFHIPAQNIDCGYSLEPPRRGGSNKYSQSMLF